MFVYTTDQPSQLSEGENTILPMRIGYLQLRVLTHSLVPFFIQVIFIEIKNMYYPGPEQNNSPPSTSCLAMNKAVDPVAQLLLTLVIGMPVKPKP